jgi:hypothetical protein
VGVSCVSMQSVMHTEGVVLPKLVWPGVLETSVGQPGQSNWVGEQPVADARELQGSREAARSWRPGEGAVEVGELAWS